MAEGIISLGHYQNYIKIKTGFIYNEMSYPEKRRKYKEFGKFYKSVMKYKKIQI